MDYFDYDFLIDRLKKKFIISFEEEADYFFSSPGRVEILGNHTDHNNGKVIVSAINIYLLAAVKKNKSNFVRISYSDDDFIVIDLRDLKPKAEEISTSIAMIRGVLSGIVSNGYKISGFDAKIESMIPRGSGVSSSAAFELVFCEICNILFNDGLISPLLKAQIAQNSEVNYFKKPCGLLDQMSISYGNINYIDFLNPNIPIIKNIDYDFKEYKMILVNTLGNHSNLTNYYAEIMQDMKKIANHFNVNILREVDENEFYHSIKDLFELFGGRAILRAIHYFEENKRVDNAFVALQNNDIDQFLKLINDSGKSSYELLQNCYYPGDAFQGITLGINLSRKILRRGAVRVHGGGFAGTILAFVHKDDVNDYITKMGNIFGQKSIFLINPSKEGTKLIK